MATLFPMSALSVVVSFLCTFQYQRCQFQYRCAIHLFEMPPTKKGRKLTIYHISFQIFLLTNRISRSASDPQQHPQRGTNIMASGASAANKQRALGAGRGRPPKHFRNDVSLAARNAPSSNLVGEHQSFIMKLFDRSLDLAKYPSKSALYPICRAWMLNQPRSDKLIKYGLLNRQGV